MTTHRPDSIHERYWNEPNTPLYPFGFGLSYTSFAYANLRLSKESVAVGQSLEVMVDVTNTGKRDGDEVAQLYIHQRYGSAARPVRMLKGFERVALKAGETKTLTFTLGPDELQFWSAAKKTWVQDETTFDVWVGKDSTADLTTTFAVTAA